MSNYDDHVLARPDAVRVGALLEQSVENLSLLQLLSQDSANSGLDAAEEEEIIEETNGDDNTVSVVRNDATLCKNITVKS